MRVIKNINENWKFKFGFGAAVPEKLPTGWQEVNLPFTWNGDDGQDGGNDYKRGIGCFAKELKKEELPTGEEIYLQLDGVNSICEVFFNGKKICTHSGGYSTFRTKLQNISNENLLVITADNSENERVYPQVADFTFYGGIYRNVSLIGVGENHFDLDYFGSPGIMVTPKVNGNDAEVMIKAFCTGDVNFQISDSDNAIASICASGKNPQVTVKIKDVHLWDGKNDPFLYTATATLVDGENELDKISTRFGCRSFEIDPDKGFILNGREYPLRGVSRHQDRPHIGNALLNEHHKEDMDLICEMGANAVRLAHYQHAQYFYDLCDERGIIVWAEIPYISKHMENANENTRLQMTELICQNYNHPSIVVWGLSNEISMGGAGKEVIDNHQMLNDLVHLLDKTRLTTEAVLTACPVNEEYVHIPDVVSYNHYFGWYGGSVDMYGKWFDNFHKKYPKKAIGLSEYGCEALNWHTSAPEQGDYTEEYQAYYHEELIKQIAKRPYLWATFVWNMFDFAADARAEGGENGINHKGLVTFDRKYKKDSFFAYKAQLSNEAVLHICSKRYVERVEDTVKIKIYSNFNEVELFANGKSVGKQTKGEFPFFTFEVKNEGETHLIAKAGNMCDEAEIKKVDKFNDSYRLKEEGSPINWFEIETPPGYFSVNDTIGDILSTFKGKLFALKMIGKIKTALSPADDEKSGKNKKEAEVMGFRLSDISKTMIDMIKGFTVKRALMMLSGKFTKEQILEINASLNKIKKKR